MNTEDIQSLWQQYDEKLEKNLRLNKELLRKINLTESRRAMRVPLISDVVSVCVMIVCLLWIVPAFPRMLGHTGLIICWAISVLCFVLATILGLIMIRKLSGIQYETAPVLQLQKQITSYRKTYQLYKKIGHLTMPLLLIAFLPVSQVLINKINYFDYPFRFGITIILCLLLAYPTALWMYKKWYEEKLDRTNQYLQELREFEKE